MRHAMLQRKLQDFAIAVREAKDEVKGGISQELSVRKSVLVPSLPLKPWQVAALERLFRRAGLPLRLVLEAVYLGILLGPLVDAAGVFRRALGRLADLPKRLFGPWGKEAQATLWNVYAVPTLAFPGKFVQMPGPAKTAANVMMRRFARSPGSPAA